MEAGFLRFVWRHSWRWQLSILAITVAVFPLVYLSLELPKIIINDAIQGGDGPRALFGFEIGRLAWLLTLCCALLALIGVVNALKWRLNVTMGRTGERMLRRMRYMLFERVMRFPAARFRSARQGELIQSMLGELEPVGGFIGEVIATPLFQGGLLAVYAGFIFVQDWRLGLAAVAMFPLQGWLIPRMQARVIRLNRERALGARDLADFIGDSVARIDDVIVDGAGRWRLAQLSARLHRQGRIRLALFRRKYAIKAVNNLLNQLPPFFFYAVGGWLVIGGRLDFGALVAVLAAQKEMASPWREILVYVQNWTDYRARFGFVVEGFGGPDLLPQTRIDGAPGAAPLGGDCEIVVLDGGPGAGGLFASRLILPQGAMVAVLGGEGGARAALMRMIAGLETPVSGAVTLGGVALGDATLPQIGAALGHVGDDPPLGDQTVRAALTAGLLRRPPPLSGAAAAEMLEEARLTGAAEVDPEGDWTDYAAAGVADAAGLEARVLALAQDAGLAPDLRALALDAPIPADALTRWAPLVAAARAALAQGEDAALVADLVAPWRRDALNPHARLLDNLLFGAVGAGPADIDAALARADIAALLRETGAEAALVEIGEAIAAEFAGLVAAAGRDSAVFADIAGFTQAQILAAAEYAASGPPRRRAAGRRRFMAALAAGFTPARDRLDVLDAARAARVLALREAARAALAKTPSFVFFDSDGVNPALSLFENVVRGARRFDRRGAARGLVGAVEAALLRAGAEEGLLRLGLSAPVGRAGARLPRAARQRAALARALLKRPRVLVIEATLAPDALALARRAAPGATLIYAAADEAAAQGADLALRIDAAGLATLTPGPMLEGERRHEP